MAKGAPDWSNLMRFWDGTTLATQYESTPIFKLSELPSLTPGSADIGTINTKYFPTMPTAPYYKGSSVVVGAGDATKTDTITITNPAYVHYIHVETTTPNATNYFKVEHYNSDDDIQATLIFKAFDGIISKFPLVLPKLIAQDDYLKITYTNDAGAGNTVIWNVGYLWTGTVAQGTVISSFASPSNQPYDLAWDGTYLWNTDVGTNLIYKLNPDTGATVDSFAAPAGNTRGLTFDGTYLRCSDITTDLIYKLNPETGAVISSFATPDGNVGGLTWDGTYLWCCDFNTNKIYKLNPETGAVISSFVLPATSPSGLAWDGTYLWCVDYTLDTVWKLNPVTGAVISSFDAPGGNPHGLTFDGTYLRCSESNADLIYKIQI